MKWRCACATLLAALAAACASAPPAHPGMSSAAVGGRQFLSLLTMGDWSMGASSASGGFGSLQRVALDGAKCTARNSKGVWAVVTPGIVEVLAGEEALTVECSRPGYRSARAEMKKCVTPRMRSSAQGAWAGLHAFGAMGPAVVYVAPAVVLAALVGSMATGAAVGNAVAGPNADVCELILQMERE